MNRKKPFVSKILKSIILEIFQMLNFYKIRFYAFPFVACRVSVHAFLLFIVSKLLIAKLCPFVFRDTFAEWLDIFLSFVRD